MTKTDARPPKRVLNKDLVCLQCDNEVYAKFLCKTHYNAIHRKKQAERRRADREARKRANLEKIRRELELNGSPCRIASCTVITIDSTGLCGVHKIKAAAWQFTPDELVMIYTSAQCEICGSTEWLVLDHAHGLDCEPEHRSNNGCPSCFRGLLCNGCNSALGFCSDDPNRLRLAASYLERNSQVG